MVIFHNEERIKSLDSNVLRQELKKVCFVDAPGNAHGGGSGGPRSGKGLEWRERDVVVDAALLHRWRHRLSPLHSFKGNFDDNDLRLY